MNEEKEPLWLLLMVFTLAIWKAFDIAFWLANHVSIDF